MHDLNTGVKLKGQNIKLKKKNRTDTLLSSPAEQSKVTLYNIDVNVNIGSWTEMNMNMKWVLSDNPLQMTLRI